MSGRRTVVLELTFSEANGLLALASEGKEGLLTDKEAAKAYVGTKAQQDAAVRGYDKLGSAVLRAARS